jgi:hypothetical protein
VRTPEVVDVPALNSPQKGIACECHVFSIDYYVFLREGLVSSLLKLIYGMNRPGGPTPHSPGAHDSTLVSIFQRLFFSACTGPSDESV